MGTVAFLRCYNKCMEPNRDMLADIFKMVKENNKMLHAMRRRAFIGAFVKLCFIVALVTVPIWFYMTYLDTTVQDILRTVQQMQDAGTSAQAQIGSFETMLQDLQSKIPGFSSIKAQ